MRDKVQDKSSLFQIFIFPPFYFPPFSIHTFSTLKLNGLKSKTLYQDCWDALQWVASHAADNDAEPWIANHGNFNRLFIAGDSAGGNIVFNMTMRAGKESLIGCVKLVGAIFDFPFFLIPSVENIEGSLIYKLWNTICPPSEQGINSPVVSPVSENGPSLSELGCSRLFLCAGDKDELVPSEIVSRFAVAVKNSGWKGELDFIEIEGEGHCFQAANPEAEKSKYLIKRMASFIQRK